jgi:hypothetical protein
MAKLQYKELLESEGIDPETLPKDIKKKINALNPTIARYNKSKPPSEKLKDAIIRQDIAIADLIADYIEDGLPDAPPEGDTNNDEPPITNVDPVAVVDPVVVAPVVPAEPPTPAEPEKKPITNFGTLEMENEILADCTANNGYIEVSKLSKITGISESSLGYPHQLVYSIKLSKVYLKALYKLQ